ATGRKSGSGATRTGRGTPMRPSCAGPASIDIPDTSCPIVRLDPGTPARARSRTHLQQELPGSGAVQDTEAAGTARAGDRMGQGSARPASGTSWFPGLQDNRPQRLAWRIASVRLETRIRP